MRKYGFMHLHVAEAERSLRGKMAGYATRSLGFLQLSNAFPQFVSSSFSITAEKNSSFSRIKIIWFVFGYTQGQFECQQTFQYFLTNLPWFSLNNCQLLFCFAGPLFSPKYLNNWHLLIYKDLENLDHWKSSKTSIPGQIPWRWGGW